ncbi:MAG: hypothetical protein QOI63_357 [Thermoplasmata archaeon]|jgi:hypothetical protein|nr:hypothetical protein [Thermoplasmata archaeon]
MNEARGRAHHGIGDATLRAARRMGLSRLFLQLVAQEMPDDALVGLRLEESPDAVVARAAHLCDAGCDLSAHACLTALKMQALLGRERKSPFAVTHLAAEGDGIRVHLVPLARPG